MIDFYTSFIENHQNKHKTWEPFCKKIFAVQAENETCPKEAQKIINEPIIVDGKPLQKIKDIIKIAKNKSEIFCITNCDVELVGSIEIWDRMLRNKGLIIGQRYNYIEKYKHLGSNFGGIDFFIFNEDFEIDESEFAIGSCCWDWWITYLAMIQQIPIYKINIPFVYHEVHERNWSVQQWQKQLDVFEKTYGIKQDKNFKIKILDFAKNIF